MLHNDYRPDCLSKIVGQEKIIKDLQTRFKKNEIPKVTMLTGVTGVGKTTLQRIIGKAIVCNHKDKDGNPCCVCDLCKAIDEEKQNNFYFENNASNLNIDEVRKLIQDAEVKSFSQAKAKVFVIDEIQEMKKTQAALNNLLKPLEKDYKNVYFILGTMSDRDVPNAIKNRCVVYKLKELNIEEIGRHLFYICEQQKIKIDTEEKSNVLLTIAENSYGSMRQAIAYLERVIYSEIWTVKELIQELEIVSNLDLITSVNHLFIGDAKAFEIVYSQDLLQRLRYILGTIYKILNKVVVPQWQLTQIKGLDNKNFDSNKVMFALNELFELNKYPYLNQEIIDYTLVKIYVYCKECVTLKQNEIIKNQEQPQQPIRRRS